MNHMWDDTYKESIRKKKQVKVEANKKGKDKNKDPNDENKSLV